jgi:isopentenyl-diphosphate delta-isomerase
MVNPQTMVQNRKIDHIDLAIRSQLSLDNKVDTFNYEPLFSAHPKQFQKIPIKFLNHSMDYPFWISSMTGGSEKAGVINKNLAKICSMFNFGMGLGSTRPLLESQKYFEDFNLRPILGPHLPLFINLGIAQLENLIRKNQLDKVYQLVDLLKATGLIIHVNPLQEWFQIEGDRFLNPPIETIEHLTKNKKFPIIVKEVGQGMGPRSLNALLELKVDGIELAAFGGTNFTLLEILRNQHINKNYSSNELVKMGHGPLEMINWLNSLAENNIAYKNTEVIISGGIQNIVEGQYYRSVLKLNSVIGQARRFLEYAENFEQLVEFTKDEINTLNMTISFLDGKK